MMTGESFLSGTGQVAMAMLLFHLVKGPGAADRIIALDLLSVLVVVFLVVLRIGRRFLSRKV